jgi:hypothetical protein
VGHKVKIGAMEVELELDQIAELALKMGASPPQVAPPVAAAPAQVMTPAARLIPRQPSAKGGWDYESAWQFMSSTLEGAAKKVMGHLIANRRVSSPDLAQAINVAPNTLGPAIRSIKNKSAGMGKPMPFSIRRLEGGVGKMYALTLEFAHAASNNPKATSAPPAFG